MKKIFSIILSILFLNGFAQFKADNVKYKTVFPEDLCSALNANPGFVILDVRSDAEFNDTMSMSPGLNIGHFNNAMHIDIRQLPVKWRMLSDYKNKPLFVYCSHSQRSRRASRLLADSGFTNIININGGLTNFYAQGIQYDSCGRYKIVSDLPYKILSVMQLLHTINNYYIIDIRKDSIYNGKTTNESLKMEGRFENAINIPFEKLADATNLPTSKPILLVDESGDQSALAAKIILNKGVKNVSILFNGMEEWTRFAINSKNYKNIKWISYSDYSFLSPDEFSNWQANKKLFAVIDVRPKNQFNNQSKNYWQNIGQIKNAVNVPFDELSTNASLPTSKSTPIVLYGFNSEDEIFNEANWLKKEGFKQVYILYGGIWYMRWAAHNIKNKMFLNDNVVNVPVENE